MEEDTVAARGRGAWTIRRRSRSSTRAATRRCWARKAAPASRWTSSWPSSARSGPDGYPKLLYDKWTGVIDRSVADYWRDHYDLRHIVERDWKTLGPKLVGKIHIFMGDQDTFLLEEATYKLQEFLESTKDPYYAGSFEIGKRQPHCYAGTPEFPANALSSGTFRR